MGNAMMELSFYVQTVVDAESANIQRACIIKQNYKTTKYLTFSWLFE